MMKIQILFLQNMHDLFLEFDCVHINKTYFLNNKLFLYFFQILKKNR